MGHVVMFTEDHRLAREAHAELAMATESAIFSCAKCRREVKFTAKLDTWVAVKCPKCGKVVEVIIESLLKKTA